MITEQAAAADQYADSPGPEGLLSAEPLATPDQKAHDSFTTYQRACEAMGASLTVYRIAANLSRPQLAERMRKSVSTIRRAETGQSLLTVDFWRTADHLLTTGGRLAAAWPHVAELKRIADLNRAASVAAHEIAIGCLNPRDCLCFVAVAHWRQREVRALRLALRMGFYDWVRHERCMYAVS
ncbi:helix-turn-helix domain-containing protein [Hamadaea sp. NPDC051192]|uniref:helix-turn-helix domain-containing protein n=1 Tax=Hamadaea sp. NPDC051192 TaxID=3154940 RepID=UPI00341CE86C